MARCTTRPSAIHRTAQGLDPGAHLGGHLDRLARYGVAFDGTDVYWTTTSGGTIEKVPLSGGSPAVVATSEYPYAIAVDDSNVYFTAAKAGRGLIVQVPIAGGTPITLAPDAGENLVGIAVDATNVYWTDGLSQTVRRVPIGGGCVTTLATGQNGPSGIAVDDGNVYWTDTDGNSVMKLPK